MLHLILKHHKIFIRLVCPSINEIVSDAYVHSWLANNLCTHLISLPLRQVFLCGRGEDMLQWVVL